MKMAKKAFVPTESSFGMIDEQATQDAFVEYVGGTQKADRLSRLWNNSYACGTEYDRVMKTGNYRSKIQVFRAAAIREGFTSKDADAFMAL
jgi:hypothetical protein